MCEDIIQQFSDHLSGEAPIPPSGWSELQKDADLCLKVEVLDFHKGMQSYYKMYITANHSLFRDREEGSKMSRFVEYVFERDDNFAEWMAGQDIIAMTEKWIEAKRSEEFFRILKRLVYLDFQTDWEALHAKVFDAFGKQEVYGNATINEFYSILHGFMTIMKARKSYNERVEMFEQFIDNWNFLKHLYSVMLGRMVGLGLQNFVQVANNVKSSPNYHPHLQLIYVSMKGRLNELGLKADAYRKMNEQLKDIEQKIQRTPQSTELEALCAELFPDDFRGMLDKYRYKPYNELQDKIKALEEETKEIKENLQARIDVLAEKLKEAVENAIPITVVKDELLKVGPEMGMEVFIHLNALLTGNEVWAKHAADIKESVYGRRQKYEAKLPPTFTRAQIEEITKELSTIFYNKVSLADSFVCNIIGLKPSAITAMVNRMVSEDKICKDMCHRPLWKVLNKHGLYKASESNWNQQVK